MTDAPPPAKATAAIPTAMGDGTIVDQVIEAFTIELLAGGFDPETAERLRMTLASKGDYSAEAIRTALFQDDAL